MPSADERGTPYGTVRFPTPGRRTPGAGRATLLVTLNSLCPSERLRRMIESAEAHCSAAPLAPSEDWHM
eukprot:197556-Hanusia_phi.AAC.1